MTGKEICQLKATRGKVHDYIGMKLDYSKKGEVGVDMKEYILHTIKDFPEEIGDKVTSSAAGQLFQVDPGGDKLNEELAQAFHTAVVRLLFVCESARQDIQTAIAFLTTRVNAPDNYDWKNLKCLLRYIKGTMDLTLILTADNLNILKWWVDGAYIVYKDMESHTGATMTLGKGSVYRYNVNNSVVFQDNKTARLLEENGKVSCGKRTKHNNIRYFLVQDQIEKGELEVKYCPTDNMVGDHFSKPVKG
eukprot:11012607-Ditylum_brightwellii.AAC.1